MEGDTQGCAKVVIMAAENTSKKIDKKVNAGRQGSALSHMPAIDGLRGVAILLVLLHHFTPAVSGSPFTRRLLELTHTGWVGVDLFFVLSGFLVTAILLRTRTLPDYFLNFYARRTLRIFPLYYGVIAVVLLVIPTLMQTSILVGGLTWVFGKSLNDLPALQAGQSWLWLYGTNLKVALEGERWGAVNHLWSLAVEEHFYLVWPVVVYFMPKDQLKRFCLMLIFAAPLLRAILMLAGMDSVVPYVLTPCRVDSLAVGALLAAVVSDRNGLATWTPRLGAMALLSVVGLGALVVYYHRFDRQDLFTTIAGYSLMATVSAYLVLKAAQIQAGTRACKIVANPVLTALGKYSYGIYLTHMFFQPLYVRLFPWTALHHLTGAYWSAIVLHAVLSIACSWGIAWVSFHAFEKHFLKLKTMFDYRKPVTESVKAPRQPVLFRPMRQAA